MKMRLLDADGLLAVGHVVLTVVEGDTGLVVENVAPVTFGRLTRNGKPPFRLDVAGNAATVELDRPRLGEYVTVREGGWRAFLGDPPPRGKHEAAS